MLDQGCLAVCRRDRKMIAQWMLSAAATNFPMARDAAHRRVFIGCRRPAQLLVYATDPGAQVAALPLHGDCDDVFYDAAHARLYASCGEGYVDVFTQADADRYGAVASVPTAAGARRDRPGRKKPPERHLTNRAKP